MSAVSLLSVVWFIYMFIYLGGTNFWGLAVYPLCIVLLMITCCLRTTFVREHVQGSIASYQRNKGRRGALLVGQTPSDENAEHVEMSARESHV